MSLTLTAMELQATQDLCYGFGLHCAHFFRIHSRLCCLGLWLSCWRHQRRCQWHRVGYENAGQRHSFWHGGWLSAICFVAGKICSCFQSSRFWNQIHKCWNCKFLLVSVESCGSNNEWAFDVYGPSTAMNCSKCFWGAVHVERCYSNVMRVSANTLFCTFAKVHSERAIANNAVTTWDLGGAGTYNSVRLHATNANVASARFYGTNLVVTALRVEDDAPTYLNATGGGMTLIEPAAVLLPDEGQNGTINIVGGHMSCLKVGAHWSIVNATIIQFEVGANLDAQLITVANSTIGSLGVQSGSVNQSATFENCIIGAGSFLNGETVLRSGCQFTPTPSSGSTQISYCKVTIESSQVIGNLVIDTAAVQMRSGGVIQGNLTITANPQCLCDYCSYATGTVVGWTHPINAPAYLPPLSPGMQCKNLLCGAGGIPGWFYTTAGNWSAMAAVA